MADSMQVRLIGVDFDNTIVSYDEVMRRVAVQRGLITHVVGAGKREIRDRVRQLANGEHAWQRLQSLVYGTGMDDARLIEGTRRFFERCKRSNIPVYIISHKTAFATQDETGTNLRVVAMRWMKRHRFFGEEGLGLSEARVYFESTRLEKIERVRQLQCTHFIDDLEETFLEASFPPHVEKLLYEPSQQGATVPGVRRMRSWQEIYDYFFDGDP